MALVIRPSMQMQSNLDTQKVESPVALVRQHSSLELCQVDTMSELEPYQYQSDDAIDRNEHIISLDHTVQTYEPKQQLAIYKKQLDICRKLINSNKVLQRRLQIATGFMDLDAFKKEKPKNVLQKVWDKIRGKKVTVKAIKQTGYNMSDTTLRNDLELLCNLGILQKESVINENGRRVNDYKLRA